MNDIVHDLQRLQKAMSELDGKEVVADSKQTFGTAKDQLLPLSQRLGNNKEEAIARSNLEATQLGLETAEDDALDDQIAELWADDIINKALDRIFGE